MRKIDIEELKQLQLGILDVVVSYCDSHNIKYWLDCGTLLGAVRHNGYIPWDDDIDIGMLRDDFNRFVNEFNSFNPRFQTYCIDTSPDFYFVFAKVLDMNTVLYEPDEKGQKLAVNIDVFVYDNAPEDESELKKAFDRRDFYRNCSALRTLHNKPSGGLARRIFVRVLRGILKIFPKNYFIGKMAENAKRYNNIKTSRVGNFSSFTRAACSKRVFDSFEEHIFEGKMYKIPVGYDDWLRSFFGDYMKLPPEEKRVSHHKFIAYMDD